MPSIEEDAVQRKRKYPTLDLLVSDDDLRKHVTRYETGDPEPLLTIGTALLRDHWPSLFSISGLLQSVEENVSIFLPRLTSAQRASLAANLLNGREQFLNTVSELGLARHYHEDGWEVNLAVPLPPKKDVDMCMTKQGEARWLDAVNAAPNDEEKLCDGFIAPLAPRNFEMRLIDKVIQKFQSKFEEAVGAGWNGSPWLALDIIKNDAIAVAVTVHDQLGTNKLNEFAEKVLWRCPKLDGIVYYAHYGDEPKAHWVREFTR